MSQNIEAPIDFIKRVTSGTTLGVDWNLNKANGFKLYPLPVQLTPSSLAELDQKKAPCLKAASWLSAKSHDRFEFIAMWLFWRLQEFRDAMGLINTYSGS